MSKQNASSTGKYVFALSLIHQITNSPRCSVSEYKNYISAGIKNPPYVVYLSILNSFRWADLARSIRLLLLFLFFSHLALPPLTLIIDLIFKEKQVGKLRLK